MSDCLKVSCANVTQLSIVCFIGIYVMKILRILIIACVTYFTATHRITCIAYMMLWYDSTETHGHASLYDLYDGILH